MRLVLTAALTLLLVSCAKQVPTITQPIAPTVAVADVVEADTSTVTAVVREVNASRDLLADENTKLESKLDEVKQENKTLSGELFAAEVAGSANAEELARFRARSEAIEQLNEEANELVTKQRDIIVGLTDQLEVLHMTVSDLRERIAKAVTNAEQNKDSLFEANDRIAFLTEASTINADAATSARMEIKNVEGQLAAANRWKWTATTILVLIVLGNIALWYFKAQLRLR